MLAVDSSALIAIMRREPEAERFSLALRGQQCAIGWPTVFECRIVAIRQEVDTPRFLDRFLTVDAVDILPFDAILADMAEQAFLNFGKGRHPAKLNFGDCMTYAVARTRNLPLLFKGADFGKTDIAVHPASVIIEREDN